MRKISPKKVRSIASDALLLLGASAMTSGVWLVYMPAGLFFGGLCAVGICLLLARTGGDNHAD